MEEGDETNDSNENDEIFEGLVENYCPVSEFVGSKNYNEEESNESSLWENEVNGLLKNVKEIKKYVSEDLDVSNVYNFDGMEADCNNTLQNKEDLKPYLIEIEKMDAILKIKVAEEKKAKLFRIQAEEESRDILSNLQFPTNSNGIQNNLNEFMRFLNDSEKVDHGTKLNESKSLLPEEKNTEDIEKVEAEEKQNNVQSKNNNVKFIERNIQLAKCGRGTLSLTDAEKVRIENLLINIEEPKEEEIMFNRKEAYAINDEIISALCDINKKLEVLGKHSRKEESLTAEEESDETMGEKGKTKVNMSNENEKQKRTRLNEINKLLNAMNSACNDEITPMTEKEMKQLIEQSKVDVSEECEHKELETLFKLPQDTLTELVTNAKLLMPKFKYRYQTY